MVILKIEDVYTAIDSGWELLANVQLNMAKKSGFSGDINVYNKQQLLSVNLYANVTALSGMNFNHDIATNKTISLLYNNIKLITKDLRVWN